MDAYDATRLRHIAYAMSQVPGHLERLTWSVERLRSERTRRLRALLAVARERSSWHRRRLVGVDIAAIDEQSLSALPIMTKDDLMSHFDEIVTDPRVTLDRVNAHIAGLTSDAYFLDDLHAVASGGSSGVRGAFVWSWEAWAECFLVGIRNRMADLLRDAELASLPMVSMIVAAENASHFTSAAPQTFATATAETHRFPVTMPLEEMVAGLNRVNGTYLIGYASTLGMLAAEALAGRLTISPRRIVSTAEPLLPETRAAVEAAWGAPIANMWGTSEAGITAVGCFQDRGMHVSEDMIIVEPVDRGGAPVAPGTTSACIYLTNLYNGVLPLLRYEITDEVTFLPEPCACGSAYRRIADIHGRLDDTFTYPANVTVHPHVFRSALGRHRDVVEYQVRQTRRGADILLRTRGPVDLALLEQALSAELRRLGCADALVTAKVVDRLSRQETGKLKRFVPLSSEARGR